MDYIFKSKSHTRTALNNGHDHIFIFGLWYHIQHSMNTYNFWIMEQHEPKKKVLQRVWCWKFLSASAGVYVDFSLNSHGQYAHETQPSMHIYINIPQKKREPITRTTIFYRNTQNTFFFVISSYFSASLSSLFILKLTERTRAIMSRDSGAVRARYVNATKIKLKLTKKSNWKWRKKKLHVTVSEGL